MVALLMPVPGLLPVPGRKLEPVPRDLFAVLRRPEEFIVKVKPPVDPMLDNLPVPPRLLCAPVLGRDPAVPSLVPVNGLTPVPGRIFCLAFSSAIALSWASAASAISAAWPST
mmetsp:Transcript_62790/g.147330  ORF Transcript_62790/g.147330 Transcript_62790/m.147330 type:complete len:113 (-) Transcript_62790:1071-1409(-)